MSKDAKILIKKGLILLTPVFIWVLIVYIVDPFNYFNKSNLISEKDKKESALELNSLLYNSIQFKNNPIPNVIIGDSRIRKFPTDRIKQITGDEYYTIYSNAAKLNEIIDLFWFTTECTKMKNIIIGINFNLYNEYAYSNRVSDVKELLENKFIYIFNWNILEAIFLVLKNKYFGINQHERKNKKIFWDYTINTVAKNHYSKWKHPDKSLFRLKEMGVYCKANNINLTLLVVPHQKEFHNKLVEFNLIEEEIGFKNEIKNIGRVIDFDFTNSITNCKPCFNDPIHTTDSVSTIIVNEIFADSLTIGREL
jgi:hypothetical protein